MIVIRFFVSFLREGGIFRAVGNARPLDPVKWCYLVSAYNASSGPCRLAVLPPIRLCSAVSPTRAISLRNPLEKPTPTFKWDKLALALDPSDESVGELFMVILYYLFENGRYQLE